MVCHNTSMTLCHKIADHHSVNVECRHTYLLTFHSPHVALLNMPYPSKVPHTDDTNLTCVALSPFPSSCTNYSDVTLYPGHPSASLPRALAFPLCQEYLLAYSKETVLIANAPPSRPHHHTTKRSDPFVSYPLIPHVTFFFS